MDTPAPPRVVALHVAPEKKAPTRSVEAVEVRTGGGIEGDRYAGTRHRHVSVQSADDLAAAADELGVPVEPGSTRRNITLSHGPVPTAPGDRLRIGDVELEVVRVAAPCPVMDRSVAPGARSALRRRGGSIFRVLHGGRIAVGDRATPDPPVRAPGAPSPH